MTTTLTNISQRLGTELLSCYLRVTPWEAGRWRLLKSARRWCEQTFSRGGQRTISTRYGFRMAVDLSDWLGRAVYVSGEYEPAVSRVMSALLPSGGTMIDAGANVGYFTLLAARRVGPQGIVWSFEPVPFVRKQLHRNIMINHFKQVTVCDVALSDRAGEVTFYEGPVDHRGLSSMRAIDDASQTHRVQCARLADVLPADVRVDLVKVDVEGAEAQVIEGMWPVLERDKPDLIVEITDEFLREMSGDAASLCDRLTSLGYRAFAIDYDGVVPMESCRDSLPRQFNALFTMRSSLPENITVKSKWVG